MEIGIAVFAYNRLDHISSLMQSLTMAAGFEEYPVTIYVDGPKGASDTAKVLAVREFVERLALTNVSWVFSETNLGLKASILKGVSNQLERYEACIVLEDDLTLEPHALEYFRSSLWSYRDCERVWAVCGYMFQVPSLSQRKTVLLLPFSHPWGWATWRRAWQKFDPDKGADEALLKSKSFRRTFNAGVRDFSMMLSLAQRGLVNSWYIRWYLNVFEAGGVCVFPPQSMVANLGISGADATHGSALNPYYLFVKHEIRSKSMPLVLDEMRIDYAALDEISRCLECRIQRFIDVAGAFKRRIRNSI
ncbi:hypothetical protein [Ciceribacter selenitireducens]